MYRNRLLTGLLFWLAGIGLTLGNEPSREDKIDELLKRLDEPEPFQPISPEQVSQSKKRLEQSLENLQRQLDRIDDQQAARWKSYLDWDVLTEQLEAEKPSRSKLLEVAHKYRMNHRGLELKVFTRVRGAILDYAYKSYFSSESVAKKIYDSRLKLIRSALTKLKAGHDDRTIGLLGEAITDLENSGNCPQLVTQIRSAFSKPNFHFEFSEALAKAIAQKGKKVDVQPVCEVIVGVLQRGTAHTTARFDVDFVPSKHSGKFKICINGTSLTDQVGTKELGLLGNIYICSEGTTRLVGEAVVDFDGQSLSYSEMAAGASTRSQVKGVDTPPLLRGPTLNQIEKKKSQGEAEAAAKARAKFVRQFRTQLNESIGKANLKLKNQVTSTVKRLDFEPKRLEVTTSDDHFRVLAIIGNQKHLTALQGPDANVSGDVVAQMHESMINNGLQHLFGGRSIGTKELRQLITSFGVELPPSPEDEKPLTITFPRVRPIQVAFDGQEITTIISANEIQSGRTVVKDNLKITIKYSIASTANSVTVARKEDVRIDFEGAYTNSKSIVESNIKPKLEKLFKKETREFRIAEIKLPEEFKEVDLPEIKRLEINDGWLVAQLGMRSGKVAKSEPSKKLSSIRGGAKKLNGVPIKPAATLGVTTSYISDLSVRIQD